MEYPVTAGIFITRKCNLRCKYCNIPKSNVEDMELDKWLKAFKIINDIGIKKVNILGGEPTIYKDIVEIVKYILNDTKMECSLITNSMDKHETVLKLLEIGLKNISVSIDTLNINNSISPLKAKKGIELLNILESKNLLHKIKLKVYTVINKKNINEIIDIVKYMTKKNVSVYFLPYHWSVDKDFEHRKEDNELAFISDADIRNLQLVLQELSNMKDNGYIIGNSKEYLMSISKYIKELNWKCSSLSELRVDSNGKLMCCCDKKGEVYSKFNVFDLNDKNKLNEFLQLREEDRKECKGCLWGSSFESELLKNKLTRDV